MSNLSNNQFINEFVKNLADSPLYYFKDWKNNNIPAACAGVYSIYDQYDRFIYIGMAGADLSQEKIDSKIINNKKSGLKDRLGSHASGYRSGDRFNIYVGDLYVLPHLTRSDILQISSGKVSFDSFIKNYIQKNLSYRYLITQNTLVRSLESYIQSFGINGDLPIINGKANNPSIAK
jgi:hypothetical protein